MSVSIRPLDSELFAEGGIEVKVLESKGKGNNVKLAVSAPEALVVLREELADEWG